MKKPTTSQLKKKLDKVFSEYIRQKYADSNGYVRCYTCNKPMLWRESQCGHFVPRSNLATRFSEENCRPQCVGCNVFGRGKVSVFAERLESEEKGIVARLYREGNQIVKDFPYLERLAYYKGLTGG